MFCWLLRRSDQDVTRQACRICFDDVSGGRGNRTEGMTRSAVLPNDRLGGLSVDIENIAEMTPIYRRWIDALRKLHRMTDAQRWAHWSTRVNALRGPEKL